MSNSMMSNTIMSNTCGINPKMSNTGLDKVHTCLERYLLRINRRIHVSMYHSTILLSWSLLQPKKVVNAYYGIAAAL